MTGWVFSVVITLAILAAPLSAQMVTEEWVADVPEFQWSATLAPTSVWTGSKLIVLAPPAKTHSNPEQPVTGRIYDLATDSWDLTPNLTTGFGAPNCGQNYSTVWTGSQLIVWGQKMPNKPNEGGIYDLATDSWYMPPNLQGAVDSPLNRKNHAAVWTGTHMIVFGGDVDPDTGIPNSGYMYNPTSDVWENLPNFANAVGVPFNGTPLEQGSHTGIWTGSQFVILGYNGQSIIGGVYNPSTDS
ncbi:MAG: kelch motif-containing protein, partial [Nitrospira sp.]|nr:kelch motif-containing protein [Nitrospira sp.]